MKALTLWPEWAAAIVLLGKRVENRTWKPPRSVIAQPLVLHAGAQVGGRPGRTATLEARLSLLSIPGVTEDQADQCIAYAKEWRGHILARTSVLGWGDNSTERHLLPPDLRRWAIPGCIGWLLRDALDLAEEPVPCRGAQGLWTVPADVLAQCRWSDA